MSVTNLCMLCSMTDDHVLLVEAMLQKFDIANMRPHACKPGTGDEACEQLLRKARRSTTCVLFFR
ncbi:hypothetical protein [Noviherbaspirillum cavernae]|uniref:hypothetical protein n=1 Tax=Noviherbaspirillum cavernae TaxID=2320862 RepID=UPI0011C36C10|nr:hypothetical protein [Noviherbaspirillum cavernae]